MKVWRQAFSVQRVPTTPNAQRSTLNAQRSTLNAQRSTLNLPINAQPPHQRSTSPSTLNLPINAQPPHQRSTSPSTLNLPIMAAQPQSLQPRSGAVIKAPARSSVMRVGLLLRADTPSPRAGEPSFCASARDCRPAWPVPCSPSGLAGNDFHGARAAQAKPPLGGGEGEPSCCASARDCRPAWCPFSSRRLWRQSRAAPRCCRRKWWSCAG